MDYLTRYNDTSFICFATMDPMAEKYYSISPYVYVANNPMKFIDPTGMTIWQLDQTGKIINTIDNDKIDRIEVLGNKNQLLASSSDFDSGTITQQTAKYEDGSDAYNIFAVKGYDNAKNVFETLANPNESTKVEWSLSVFEGSEKTINLISTSHNGDTESSSGYLFNLYTDNGMALTEHSHNHPLNSPYPSGIWQLAAGNKDLVGDIGAADQRINTTKAKYNVTPIFNLYDHIKNTYIPYNKNSKLSDFNIKTP